MNSIFSTILLLFVSIQLNGTVLEPMNDSYQDNAELICGEWILTKMTVLSEKTVYESDSTETFTVNCDQHTWKKVENGEELASGTWVLEDSTRFTMKSHGEKQIGKITRLSKNQLTISFPDMVCTYVRN